jgi:PKD repeat protein
MGGAVATDGSMEIQCQSCHGNMSAVGSGSRVGWFMEPNCQSCHTGTATSNNGQIRYTSCFETNGAVRVATNQTFATNPDIPAPGISLFRFSRGHGGLQCEACHGSTHAEFPATHRNDNVRNERLQGHAGVTIECTACHVSMSASATTAAGGPHGMHPLGQTWIDNHPDLIEGGTVTRAQCQACHGATYRGTVLGKAQTTRTVTSKFGTKTYWRGQKVSCYDCHDGANSSNPSANTPPVVTDVSTNVLNGASVAMTLPGSDANGNPLTFRVVSQPAHGSVGVSNNGATYLADPGYVGTDTFTFAANDGFADSNLGTGAVAVAQGPFSIDSVAHLPATWPAGWPTPFGAAATPSNTTATVTYDWDFGDTSEHSTSQYASHAYAAPGTYRWTLVARASTAQTTVSGSIAITGPMLLSATGAGSLVTVVWPKTPADAVLEQTPILPPTGWMPSTNAVLIGPATFRVNVPNATGDQFYRLRLAQ